MVPAVQDHKFTKLFTSPAGRELSRWEWPSVVEQKKLVFPRNTEPQTSPHLHPTRGGLNAISWARFLRFSSAGSGAQ